MTSYSNAIRLPLALKSKYSSTKFRAILSRCDHYWIVEIYTRVRSTAIYGWHECKAFATQAQAQSYIDYFFVKQSFLQRVMNHLNLLIKFHLTK